MKQKERSFSGFCVLQWELSPDFGWHNRTTACLSFPVGTYCCSTVSESQALTQSP